MKVVDGGPLDGPHETLVQTLWSAADNATEGGYAVRKGEEMDLMAWKKIRDQARSWAEALRNAGVEAGDTVAIIADTSREWKIADHAIHAAGAVTVPVYPTLPPDVVEHIMNDSGAKAVFVQDKEQHDKLPAGFNGQVWCFETTKGVSKTASIPKCSDPGAIDAIVNAGDLDSAGLLIYTSGTTGVPKGVLLSHRNVAGDVAGAVQGLWLDEIQDASLVAFLPLAHIAGYVSLAAMTAIHAQVLFSRPDRMGADLAWFRPRIALAVPRLWERIVRKVEEAVAGGSPIKQMLYARSKKVAILTGERMEDGGKPGLFLKIRHGFYDRLIYSKLRAKLGFDRLEIGITGAAAVRSDLLWFLQGIGLPIIEGYGMTESSALTSATRPWEWRGGTVGKPLPGSKIALDDDGEILIGGIGVFQEYWNLKQETVETRVMIDGEPWVRSGDIGELDPDDCLRIVDRKKELEVLDTGKMIAPVRVEEMLKAETSLVEDSCLIGTNRKFAAMLIQPAYDALVKWAEKVGVQPDPSKVVRQKAPTGEEQIYAINDEAFLMNPHIREEFQRALDSLNGKVADYERVRNFTLIPNAFTIDREELTPSFKKRRKNIIAHYKDKVEALFGGHSNDPNARGN